MRLGSAISLLTAALVAGCALGVPTGSTGSKASGATSKAATRAKKKPQAPPERVNLILPPSLGLVAAGGGNLIGPDGATLIGNDAGSLVGPAGAFHLLQEPVDDDCKPMPTGAQSFLPLVYLNSTAYVDAVLVANASLRAARDADPDSDEPFPVALPGGDRGIAFFSARGETGGLLRVADGPVFDASRVVLSLAYESPTKGRLVYRSAEPHEVFGRLAIAMDFDLAQGRVSADGAGDATAFPADKCGVRSPKARVHWEFRAPKKPAAGTPVFTMQAAANFAYPDRPEDSGPRGLVLHFDAKGRAAARMGRVMPGETELKFTREDGQGYTADLAVPADYFLAETGAQVTSADADEGLRALLPQPADFYQPFPGDPGGGDPLADPVFETLD